MWPRPRSLPSGRRPPLWWSARNPRTPAGPCRGVEPLRYGNPGLRSLRSLNPGLNSQHAFGVPAAVADRRCDSTSAGFRQFVQPDNHAIDRIETDAFAGSQAPGGVFDVGQGGQAVLPGHR